MATSGASINLHRDFEDDDDIVEYYARKFSRSQVNRYAELIGVEIEGKRIEDDCRRLLEEDSLDAYHWYKSELTRIGPRTLVEGIRKLDRDKLRDLTDDEMGDKVSIILYFIEWGWEEEVELIRSLQDFKNKRTYERKNIDGERAFDQLGDEATEAVQSAVTEVLPDVNSHQRHKIALNRVDTLDDLTLIVRFYAESRSSSYRQFAFREGNHGDGEFPGSGQTEVITHDYWPIKTEHIYVDYGRNEYYAELKRSAEQLLSPVIETLYNDVSHGDNVRFADPLDPDNDASPNEFVNNRVDSYREMLANKDLVDDNKKEDYETVLDEIEAVQQTRIRLEQVDVEGNLQTFVIDTESDISEFLEAFSLGDRVDTLNEKSRTREYTLQLGDLEVDVSGTKIRIAGDVSEDQERVLTALLREDGGVV